jgi:pimeloyl-ACP methyl ester carboxylesterase
VIVFDNEGMGRSSLRPGEMTVRRLGDDVAALIRALGLRKPDVFSWSMGGMIAQSFAVRHPRLVRRLVLAASAPGDGEAVAPTQRGIDAIQSEDSAAGSLELLFPPAASASRDAYVRGLFLRSGAKPVGPRATIDMQLQASGNWLIGNDPDGARVKRLSLPVLVAGGELDELLPVGNTRHLARVIPGARRVIYQDASHGFFYQHRKDFLRRLDRFLG